MTNQIARKWMSKKVISIPMDYSLYQAREIMDSYQIRHLLVKDRTEQSIGILSDRDLLRAMMPDLNSNPFDGKTAGEFDSSLTVGDVMSWPAVSVDDQTSISAVIDQMLEGKFSAVIVQKPGAAGSRFSKPAS